MCLCAYDEVCAPFHQLRRHIYLHHVELVLYLGAEMAADYHHVCLLVSLLHLTLDGLLITEVYHLAVHAALVQEEAVGMLHIAQECELDAVYLHDAQALRVLRIAVCAIVQHVLGIPVIKAGFKSVRPHIKHMVVAHGYDVEAHVHHLVAHSRRCGEQRIALGTVGIRYQGLLIEYGYIRIVQIVLHVLVGVGEIIVRPAAHLQSLIIYIVVYQIISRTQQRALIAGLRLGDGLLDRFLRGRLGVLGLFYDDEGLRLLAVVEIIRILHADAGTACSGRTHEHRTHQSGEFAFLFKHHLFSVR